MDKPDIRDLLELPDNYLFKIIVNPLLANENTILACAGTTLNRSIGKPQITATPSKKGKYVSYSLKLYIETHDELEQLYMAFRKLEGYIMVL